MNFKDLTTDQIVVIVLSVLTGLAHLAFSPGFADLQILGFLSGTIGFIINGLGYFVLIILLYFTSVVEDQKDLLRYLLLLWTLGSIVGWLIYHPQIADSYLDTSLGNKIIEVVLIFFIYRDLSLDLPEAISE